MAITTGIHLHKEMAVETTTYLVVGNRDDTFVDRTIRCTDRIFADFSSQEFRFTCELPLCWFIEDCLLGDQNLKEGDFIGPPNQQKLSHFRRRLTHELLVLRIAGRAVRCASACLNRWISCPYLRSMCSSLKFCNGIADSSVRICGANQVKLCFGYVWTIWTLSKFLRIGARIWFARTDPQRDWCGQSSLPWKTQHVQRIWRLKAFAYGSFEGILDSKDRWYVVVRKRNQVRLLDRDLDKAFNRGRVQSSRFGENFSAIAVPRCMDPAVSCTCYRALLRWHCAHGDKFNREQSSGRTCGDNDQKSLLQLT